jgi:hypothetical protein
MQKFILAAALAAAIGVPAIASAQTAPLTGTIVCRATNAGETPTGTIQNSPVVCRALDMVKISTAMSSVMNANLSPDQKAKVQAAMSVLKDELQLEPRYPGFDGNPNN